MDKAKKKLSVTPPEGEALARYTVRVKPLDVFKRQIYLHVVPLALKSALKLTVCFVILKLLSIGVLEISAELGKIHRILAEIDGYVQEYIWLIYIPLFIYFVWLLPQVIYAGVTARTKAINLAAATPPEDYAFFEGGLIYSNGKDLVRIPWEKVRLVTTSFMGMIIRTSGETDTLIIPQRYFCTEYPALYEGLKKTLKLRFIRFKKLGRDHAPMYENPREKVAILAPDGEPVGELTVTLQLSDLVDLNSMWHRQIRNKQHRGVFGVLLLLICAVMMFIAALLLSEPLLIPTAFIMVGLLLIYVVYVAISGMNNGKRILVNRRDYKDSVRYLFYPAGFLMIYSSGISYVMYEDLDLIFEDVEGLGLFFSPDNCLFIPERYMASVDGTRISHFFKASLFNLDPRRAHRRYRIDDDDSLLNRILKKDKGEIVKERKEGEKPAETAEGDDTTLNSSFYNAQEDEGISDAADDGGFEF